MDLLFPDRRLRVCVWNPTPQMASASLGYVETELKRLGTVQLVHLKSLDDANAFPCDLLVATAVFIPDEDFSQWLKGVEVRLSRQGGILPPTVICAKVSEGVQRTLMRWAIECNWYFDLIDPDHMPSLPIRVANFLRLHDHLHEVKRMDRELQTVVSKVENLEKTLAANLNIGGNTKP